MTTDRTPTVLRGCVGAITSAAVIHGLQAHGVRVVGMDTNPYSVGFQLCDSFYVSPAPPHPDYMQFILDICQREAVDAILPSAEEEIVVLAANRVLLGYKGIRLICPAFDDCVTCADKRLTYEYFDRAHLPTPALYGRHSARFPCIVKPPKGRGGRGVFVVADQAELAWRWDRHRTLIIQEYIEGPLWAVDALTSWDGTILSMVTRRKYLMQSGSMTKGITERDDEAMAYVRQIIADLHLTGPTIIEYIQGTDGPKFIEINTRFGGGGAAISMAADPTILPNLVRMIKGEATVPSEGFTEGLEMLRYYSEVFTVRKEGSWMQ